MKQTRRSFLKMFAALPIAAVAGKALAKEPSIENTCEKIEKDFDKINGLNINPNKDKLTKREILNYAKPIEVLGKNKSDPLCEFIDFDDIEDDLDPVEKALDEIDFSSEKYNGYF